MTKLEENKLVMLKALLSFLTSNQSIWQESAPVQEVVNELRGLIAAIEAVRQSTDVDHSGLVTEKKSNKSNLVNDLFEITSQVYAMATKTKDAVLQAKVNFAKSDLERLRDGEFASTGRTIISLARANIGMMNTYGITEERLALAEGRINQYENSMLSPRIQIMKRKSDNQDLKKLFASSGVLLNDQLKRLMVRYQDSNPNFYNNFISACKVVDYGTRHEKTEDPTTNPS